MEIKEVLQNCKDVWIKRLYKFKILVFKGKLEVYTLNRHYYKFIFKPNYYNPLLYIYWLFTIFIIILMVFIIEIINLFKNLYEEIVINTKYILIDNREIDIVKKINED